jgi:hypothetical protein
MEGIGEHMSMAWAPLRWEPTSIYEHGVCTPEMRAYANIWAWLVHPWNGEPKPIYEHGVCTPEMESLRQYMNMACAPLKWTAYINIWAWRVHPWNGQPTPIHEHGLLRYNTRRLHLTHLFHETHTVGHGNSYVACLLRGGADYLRRQASCLRRSVVDP